MRLKILGVVYFLTFFSSSILAQEDRSDEEIRDLFDISIQDIINVDILSATLKKQSVLEAPANAYIISKAQIASRGYLDLLELLEDIPQIEVQRNADSDYRNLVSIRGIYGNEKLLILLNGVRITPATGDFYTLGAQFMLHGIQRVEVITGPASALYGVDAFSGVVNIVTDSPTQSGLQVQGGYENGSFSYNRISVNAMARLGKVDINAAAMQSQSESPFMPQYYPQEYSWYTNQFQPFNRVVLSPEVLELYNIQEFELSAGDSFTGNPISTDFAMPNRETSIRLNLQAQNMEVGYMFMNESHHSATGVDPRLTSYDRDAVIESRQNIIYARHNYESFDAKWSIQSQLRFNIQETNPESHVAGARSSWTRGYMYGYSNSSQIVERFQYQPNKKWNIMFGGSYEFLTALPRTAISPKPWNIDLTLGEQESFYTGAAGYINNQNALLPSGSVDLDNPSSKTVPFQDSLAIPQRFYFTRYTNLGTYAQMIFSPSENLDLVLGGRYDANSRYGAAFNPRVGVVGKSRNKKWYYKAMYGTAFLAPSPAKTFRQDGSFEGPAPLFGYTDPQYADYFSAISFHYPNADLAPERLSNIEVSFTAVLTDYLSLSMNGFSTQVQDHIILTETDSDPNYFVPVVSDFLTTYTNAGILTTRGVTFQVDGFNKWGDWEVRPVISGTFIDGDTDFVGILTENRLLYHAQSTLKGIVEISNGNWSFSYRNIWKTGTWGNPIFLNKVPGYYVAHMRLGFNWETPKFGSIQLYGRVQNLFDARFYNAYNGGFEGFAAVPQEPRRINFGININLEQ